MFPISVYFGGEIKSGPTGASYSKGPEFCFSSDEAVTFCELKNKIYKHCGLIESQCTLNIYARYNVPSCGIYFTNLLVNDDSVWNLLFQNATSGSSLHIIELFVNFAPNLASSQYEPTPNPQQTMPKGPNQNMSIQKNPSNTPDSLPTQNQMNVNLNSNLESNSNLPSGLEDVISVASLSVNEYIQNDESEDELVAELVEEIEEQNKEMGGEVELQSHASSTILFDPFVVHFSEKEVGYPLVTSKKFRSKEDLEHTICEIHILQNRHFIVVKSSRAVYKVRCENETCNWNLYAKEDLSDSWFITSCPEPHTCRASSSKHEDKLLTDSFIAQEINHIVWRNLAVGPKELSAIIENKYGIVPSSSKLWRAKETVIELNFGSWTEAYASLPVLLQAIQAANPGTKFEIESDQTKKLGVRLFKRAAWAFGPAIEGFHFLRPVIGMDSICLSGKFKGNMLFACGFDAEFQLFPLAFAVVDGEDNSNWRWFMKWLRREVVGPDRTLCVISDIDKAISDVFKQDDSGWCEDKAEAVHRYCSRHIAESIQLHFKDAQLVTAFMWAVKQKEKHKFEEGMKKIENMNKRAYNWLREIGKKNPNDPTEEPRFDLWTQCEDGGFRWGIMTTSGSEDLKKVFNEARQAPINGIVEKTFYKTLKYFAERRYRAQLLAAGNVWSSHIMEKLEKTTGKAEMYKVKVIDLVQGKYEASLREEKAQGQPSDSSKYNVSIFSDKVAKCTCQKPNLMGIPCTHLLAVCGYRNLQRDDFVSHLYSAEALLNTWSPQFQIFGNSDEWPPYEGPTIIPNQKKVNQGRMEEFTSLIDMDELPVNN